MIFVLVRLVYLVPGLATAFPTALPRTSGTKKNKIFRKTVNTDNLEDVMWSITYQRQSQQCETSFAVECFEHHLR